MIIGLYDTSYMYDIIRMFGNVELPSGSSISQLPQPKGRGFGKVIILSTGTLTSARTESALSVHSLYVCYI